MSRTREERRDPVTGDHVNKFVTYKQFGMYAEEVSRVIAIDELPEIQSESEVIVKVKASTVTLKDCYIRRGIWHEPISLPATPGFDVVGTIHDMGSEAEARNFDIGDAVAVCCKVGGNARYAVVQAKDMVRVSGSVDSAQAVAVVSTYMTAYQALHRCKPRGSRETLEGTNILVTGGNGPVGRAIIELAMRAGASKIFATADRQYHSMLNQMGVCPLSLDSEKWLPLVRGKMDIVIDGICQDGYSSPKEALHPRGHLIVIGMTMLMNDATMGMCGTPFDLAYQRFSANWLMSRTTQYCPYESSQLRPAEWKHDLGYLFALLERGKIKPVVAKRISLDLVPETHQAMEDGLIDGMVVCKPWKA